MFLWLITVIVMKAKVVFEDGKQTKHHGAGAFCASPIIRPWGVVGDVFDEKTVRSLEDFLKVS